MNQIIYHYYYCYLFRVHVGISQSTMALSLVLLPFWVSWVMLWGIVRAVRMGRDVCWEVGMAMLAFHLQFCWNSMVFATAIFTLPLRLFTALHTQIKLEEQFREMKRELESFAGENTELEDKLLLAFKEREVLEKLFQDMEEDQRKTLARIDLLHDEIQRLKEVNPGLSHARGRGKDAWDWKTSNKIKEGRAILQEIMIRGDQWAGGRRPSPAVTISEGDEAFEVQKIVAIRQSIFSGFLSLLVGLVIWEAEDPCLPLVAALFTVVGMSISSVVQLFLTIKNKPASDAVALLSINCFMLGILTCPTLPRLAVMCAQWAMRAFVWLFS